MDRRLARSRVQAHASRKNLENTGTENTGTDEKPTARHTRSIYQRAVRRANGCGAPADTSKAKEKAKDRSPDRLRGIICSLMRTDSLADFRLRATIKASKSCPQKPQPFRKALLLGHLAPRIFSIPPVWPRKLWILSAKRRSSRREIFPRTFYIFKKAR